MAGRALEHFVADAGIGAAVADDARLDGEQVPVRVAADGVVEPHRVTLGVEAQALFPREREHYRAFGAHREQGSVALHVQVFLGAESAARGNLGDANLLVGNGEKLCDLPAVVPDALSL
jgi:hypothetical protein